MKVYHSLESYEKGSNTVATIGTFDGVHLGHRKILSRISERAQEIQGESLLISLHPHPRLVLYPEDNDLRLLQTIDEKIEALERIGIDKVLLIPFTKEFSRLTSSQFIQQILVETIHISAIIIGYDHHFGKNRAGGLKELQEGAAFYNFEVEEIPAHQVDNANISSTKIRQALLDGDMQTAANFLGYTYSLEGQVIEGAKKGRELGFPTANIFPDDPVKLVPKNGVYFVEVEFGERKKYGMLNIGVKPTMGKFPLSLEVNIFDFEGDLYGKKIRVYFLDRIREEKKFPSLQALKNQITADRTTCFSLIQKIS